MSKYIKVYTEEDGNTHDGYCSDPGEIYNFKQSDNFIIKNFPHKKEITRNYIIDFEKDLLDDEILINIKNYILKKYTNNLIYCKKGSAYCGCKTSTKVLKVEIICN